MYKSILLFILLSSWIVTVKATPLDDALSIVLSKSQVVQTKEESLNLARQATDLASDIELAAAYSENSTENFAAGPDWHTQLTMKYPITWGGVSPSNKQKVTALSDLQDVQDDLRKEFILEVQKVALLEVDLRNATQTHKWRLDVLIRAQKANEEALKMGRIRDQIDVRPLIQVALNAEQAARKVDMTFRLTLENISIIYGKEQWQTLQKHIVDHIKSAGKTDFTKL